MVAGPGGVRESQRGPLYRRNILRSVPGLHFREGDGKKVILFRE
jgi:hypothetical protein